MNKETFHKKYLKFLLQNKNPTRAKKEKQYLYSKHKHYGLSSRLQDTYFKELKKELTSLSKNEAFNLAKLLWSQPSHEEKSFALRILNLHSDKLNINDMPLIEKLMRESEGWVYLDNLIIPIMPIILKKDKTAYKYLKNWIKDNDFWVRRSALLAQNLFFRKGEGGDRDLFFELAKSQFDESWIPLIYKSAEEKKRVTFFIRKAIGWALRVMATKEPNIVEKFLEENKNKMSGLSYREGGKKLIYFEKVKNKSEALRREDEIKKTPKEEKSKLTGIYY